jgi:hypothetical protein
MEYFPLIVYAVTLFIGPAVLGAVALFWVRRRRRAQDRSPRANNVGETRRSARARDGHDDTSRAA